MHTYVDECLREHRTFEKNNTRTHDEFKVYYNIVYTVHILHIALTQKSALHTQSSVRSFSNFRSYKIFGFSHIAHRSSSLVYTQCTVHTAHSCKFASVNSSSCTYVKLLQAYVDTCVATVFVWSMFPHPKKTQ